jgi:very-short-patch-repair endonuclease
MLRERGERRRFETQRMDFLMLLPNGIRVIIEIDGIQHYSEDGNPSPKVYSRTVKAHRKLQLQGYHVYRFAGLELNSSQKAKAIVGLFINELFEKYGITA